MNVKTVIAGLALAVVAVYAAPADAGFVGASVNGETGFDSLGTLSLGDVGTVTGSVEGNGVAFEHFVSFTSGGTVGSIAGTPVTLSAPNGDVLTDIAGLMYDVIGNGGVIASGTSPSSVFAALEAGEDYLLRITGTSGGTLGGNYKVDVAITPIPAAALLLAPALAGLGYMGVRRRKSA
jgi:hypothetical protein